MDKEQLEEMLERHEERESIKKEEWLATVDGHQLNFAQMIVRCRDCKKWAEITDIVGAEGHGRCLAVYGLDATPADGFCYRGERMVDDE